MWQACDLYIHSLCLFYCRVFLLSVLHVQTCGSLVAPCFGSCSVGRLLCALFLRVEAVTNRKELHRLVQPLVPHIGLLWVQGRLIKPHPAGRLFIVNQREAEQSNIGSTDVTFDGLIIRASHALYRPHPQFIYTPVPRIQIPFSWWGTSGKTCDGRYKGDSNDFMGMQCMWYAPHM